MVGVYCRRAPFPLIVSWAGGGVVKQLSLKLIRTFETTPRMSYYSPRDKHGCSDVYEENCLFWASKFLVRKCATFHVGTSCPWIINIGSHYRKSLLSSKAVGSNRVQQTKISSKTRINLETKSNKNWGISGQVCKLYTDLSPFYVLGTYGRYNSAICRQYRISAMIAVQCGPVGGRAPDPARGCGPDPTNCTFYTIPRF